MSLLLIVSCVLLRLLPHLPNFTPFGAAALFSGAHLNKKFAVFIPLSALAISDYLLLYINPFANPVFNFSQVHSPYSMFHSTTIYVWLSFAFSTIIGFWLRKRKKPEYIVVCTLLVSIQFFLITNFGVWTTGMYSMGLDGLVQSYIMGLPFFKWTIIGDLSYTMIFFTGYELSTRIVKKYGIQSHLRLEQV